MAASEEEEEEGIAGFVERWNLNEDGAEKLRRLRPAALAAVLAEFDPPAAARRDPRRVSGVLIKFATDVEKRVLAQEQAIAGPQEAVATGEEIAGFVERWSLNWDAAVKLRRIRPAALAAVLADFDPPVDALASADPGRKKSTTTTDIGEIPVRTHSLGCRAPRVWIAE